MTRVRLREAGSVDLGPSGLPVISVLDVAIGHPAGAIPLPPQPTGNKPHPARALRAALRPALLRTPCVVAFSGGRDSSLLLAVAADLAAREGLDPPTALTFRYPGDDAADETSWQELVVAHLRDAGLRFEWARRDIATELDNIGPLISPFFAHTAAQPSRLDWRTRSCWLSTPPAVASSRATPATRYSAGIAPPCCARCCADEVAGSREPTGVMRWRVRHRRGSASGWVVGSRVFGRCWTLPGYGRYSAGQCWQRRCGARQPGPCDGIAACVRPSHRERS